MKTKLNERKALFVCVKLIQFAPIPNRIEWWYMFNVSFVFDWTNFHWINPGLYIIFLSIQLEIIVSQKRNDNRCSTCSMKLFHSTMLYHVVVSQLNNQNKRNSLFVRSANKQTMDQNIIIGFLLLPSSIAEWEQKGLSLVLRNEKKKICQILNKV